MVVDSNLTTTKNKEDRIPRTTMNTSNNDDDFDGSDPPSVEQGRSSDNNTTKPKTFADASSQTRISMSLPETRRVQFHPSTTTKASASGSPSSSGNTKETAASSKKSPTKIGKANPIRDSILFVCFIGILLLITMQMDYSPPKITHDGADVDDTKQRQLPLSKTRSAVKSIVETIDAVNHIQGQLASFATRYLEQQARKEACSIYWGISTIPGAGYGLFAGSDIAAGDAIFPPPQTLIPLLLFPVMMRSAQNQDLYHSVVPHSLLLQHHPKLVNVKGQLVIATTSHTTTPSGVVEQNWDAFPLRAIQPIPAGTELFVDYTTHPHGLLFQGLVDDLDDADATSVIASSFLNYTVSQLFRRMPTASDYALADQIWDDVDSSNRWIQTMNIVNSRKSIKTSTLYPTMQRAMERLNPRVAQLLPSKQRSRSKGQSTALESLHNQTLLRLQVHATCLLEDIQYESTTITSTSITPNDPNQSTSRSYPVAGRSVDQGTILTRIPWHVVLNPTVIGTTDRMTTSEEGLAANSLAEQQCRAPLGQVVDTEKDGRAAKLTWLTSACLGQSYSRILLCPLAHTQLFSHNPQMEENNGGHTEDQEQKGNIEFRWSHPTAIELQSVRDVLDLPVAHESLVWDVVATRPIQSGERLRYRIESISERMFPDQWKIKKPTE